MKILELGCGIGFWLKELALRGMHNLSAADLTQTELDITAKRLLAYGVSAEHSQQNAEKLTFEDASFDHVNRQSVIHQTPNTDSTIAEMARVLEPGGTAGISVYYRNSILRAWPYLRWLGWPLAKLGGGLKGRFRENMFLEKDVDQIVRLYDGPENPIGKSYSKKPSVEMLQQHFIVEETYLHFFPARALPFRVPAALHRWLDKNLGFKIYASVRKL